MIETKPHFVYSTLNDVLVVKSQTNLKQKGKKPLGSPQAHPFEIGTRVLEVLLHTDIVIGANEIVYNVTECYGFVVSSSQ